jgi:hypothetical protein
VRKSRNEKDEPPGLLLEILGDHAASSMPTAIRVARRVGAAIERGRPYGSPKRQEGTEHATDSVRDFVSNWSVLQAINPSYVFENFVAVVAVGLIALLFLKPEWFNGFLSRKEKGSAHYTVIYGRVGIAIWVAGIVGLAVSYISDLRAPRPGVAVTGLQRALPTRLRPVGLALISSLVGLGVGFFAKQAGIRT